MRVVFCVTSTFAVRHTINELLFAYEQAGDEVHVVGPGAQENGGVDGVANVANYHPVSIEREINPIADLLTVFEVAAILRRLSPDLVDVSTPKMALVGGIASWIARVPKRVYTIKGLRYETTTGLKRRVLVFCEWLACRTVHIRIAVSRSVRDAMVRDGVAGLGEISVLGERGSEGINLLDYAATAEMQRNAETFREARGWGSNSIVLGYVGRMTVDKGVYELIEAFVALRESGAPVKLLLVGPLDESDDISRRAEAKIQGHPDVFNVGYAEDDRLYFQVMDILVFPTYREGLPKVPMQASAAGKPIVATRVTGVVDAVEDEVTGILVEPRDVEALRQGIERLIADPQLRSALGQNGVAFAARHFCAATMSRRYIDFVMSS